MRIVFDIEANALENPDKIWVIVCKDIDTKKYYIFRNVHEEKNKQDFIKFAGSVTHWIGHNICGYDIPNVASITGFTIPCDSCTDTLVVSKLSNYSLDGHSVEAYGERYGLPKGDISDFTCYSQSLETYCIRDVDICERIYNGLSSYINNPSHLDAIATEQLFELKAIGALHGNGFFFNTKKAQSLLVEVEKDLASLDTDILLAFPPRTVSVRSFTPKATKFGTISLTSIPKNLREKIHEYEVGKEYQLTKEVVFNPASHKQVIDVLTEAGWQPIDKTKGFITFERERYRQNSPNIMDSDVDLETLMGDNEVKLEKLEKYGWKINELNLSTLPPDAPLGARLLAKRILLESRRRTLTEWLGLVQSRPGLPSRIHGRFYGIGAWTHRMAHQAPNTANIPNHKDNLGNVKLLGKEMRELWRAPPKRLLVGVDAEGIQLRIFAHYINDPEFTAALVNGKKEDGSDPHSLNQRIIGDLCTDRQAAKRFIFALLLGAGMGKLAEILDCERDEAEAALERILVRYQGFAFLKREVIPQDAKRGWFVGLDGRSVPIPSDSFGGRKHLAMSGYLQNGEAVVMKRSTLKWIDKLADYDAKLVNFVHDEWQVECPNDFQIALAIGKLLANSLEETGKELNLRCPLAGAYHNGKDYTIGTNWYQTH